MFQIFLVPKKSPICKISPYYLGWMCDSKEALGIQLDATDVLSCEHREDHDSLINLNLIWLLHRE